MLIPVPDGISDEAAVLADPFAVSLHAIVRHPPPPGGKALVYGAGALGVTSVAALKALYPDVEVAVIARFEAQTRACTALRSEHRGRTRAADRGRRSARRMVGRRAPRAVRRASRRQARRDRRRLRHDRPARDTRGRGAVARKSVGRSSRPGCPRPGATSGPPSTSRS